VHSARLPRVVRSARARLPVVVARAVGAPEAVEEEELEELEVAAEAEELSSRAVVKLHCTTLEPDWVNPWQARGASS